MNKKTSNGDWWLIDYWTRKGRDEGKPYGIDNTYENKLGRSDDAIMMYMKTNESY